MLFQAPSRRNMYAIGLIENTTSYAFFHVFAPSLVSNRPSSGLPSSSTSSGCHLRPTSLQLLQNIYRVVASHVEHSFSLATSSDIFHDVVRVCCANHRDLRSKPLLEGLRDEVAVCGEPLGKWCADVYLLGGIFVHGCRCEGHVDFVDGDVLLCGRCDSHLDMHVNDSHKADVRHAISPFLSCPHPRKQSPPRQTKARR